MSETQPTPTPRARARGKAYRPRLFGEAAYIMQGDCSMASGLRATCSNLYYQGLIGEECEKRREAVLEFSGIDVTRTAEILDWHAQHVFDSRYADWARTMWKESEEYRDSDSAYFYHGIWTELVFNDQLFFDKRYEGMGVLLMMMTIGRNPCAEVYGVECHRQFAPIWGDAEIILKDETYPERGGIGYECVIARQKGKWRQEAAQPELEQDAYCFSSGGTIKEMNYTTQDHTESRPGSRGRCRSGGAGIT